MNSVGTSEAAFLLNISAARVRVLLSQGRVKGAYKNKRGFWQIPLYKQMPVIAPGTRGPKGLWYLRQRQSAKKIYVNKHQIDHNKKLEPSQRQPVIKVEQGKRAEYGYQIVIEGESRLVYRPDEPLHGCKGAVLWIETFGAVHFIDIQGNPITARQEYSLLAQSP